MLALYHIDAFTNRVFKGNSACVVILQEELPYQTLLNIAKENAVAETAFILTANNTLFLRWFTPDLEMDLCGHATLAAAFVIFNYYPHFITKEYITFSTQEGNINVIRELNGNDNYIYTLNFPIREGIKADLPQIIQESLSIQPKEVYLSRDYHLVYESQKDILNLEIDMCFPEALGRSGQMFLMPSSNLLSNAVNSIISLQCFFDPTCLTFSNQKLYQLTLLSYNQLS